MQWGEQADRGSDVSQHWLARSLATSKASIPAREQGSSRTAPGRTVWAAETPIRDATILETIRRFLETQHPIRPLSR